MAKASHKGTGNKNSVEELNVDQEQIPTETGYPYNDHGEESVNPAALERGETPTEEQNSEQSE
ncbi:hypothetical protein [Leptolyngbya sp. FACHB-711]|uniref:hypothetical protein n=1 Tax=unclassified Leptolyngbya TaxID=2650499 RepID=UPI001687C585|nr:hypothetical protein [Leptolyngbya sp. FACHB-711]MBD1850506.1 hypothetical protein [Cyanobacteria bacterium FACHB-502]MBD2023866.1 hypothetical protein [Leptolyngbya sp. FACHB-711]